jgi:post-segregation antitoxin (ccd killing protein)
MPKVSVYLPDDLYRQVQERHLPLSALAQHAISQAITDDDKQRWVADMRGKPPLTRKPVDTQRLLDEVRDEFGQ